MQKNFEWGILISRVNRASRWENRLTSDMWNSSVCPEKCIITDLMFKRKRRYQFVIKSFWNQHLVVQQGIRKRWLLCNLFTLIWLLCVLLAYFFFFCFLLKLFELDIEADFQSSMFDHVCLIISQSISCLHSMHAAVQVNSHVDM